VWFLRVNLDHRRVVPENFTKSRRACSFARTPPDRKKHADNKQIICVTTENDGHIEAGGSDVDTRRRERPARHTL